MVENLVFVKEAAERDNDILAMISRVSFSSWLERVRLWKAHPVTPGGRIPRNVIFATGGTHHQVRPTAQMEAASVRTTGVPRVPVAPYVLLCESLATASVPGQTCPIALLTSHALAVERWWNSCLLRP